MPVKKVELKKTKSTIVTLTQKLFKRRGNKDNIGDSSPIERAYEKRGEINETDQLPEKPIVSDKTMENKKVKVPGKIETKPDDYKKKKLKEIIIFLNTMLPASDNNNLVDNSKLEIFLNLSCIKCYNIKFNDFLKLLSTHKISYSEYARIIEQTVSYIASSQSILQSDTDEVLGKILIEYAKLYHKK